MKHFIAVILVFGILLAACTAKSELKEVPVSTGAALGKWKIVEDDRVLELKPDGTFTNKYMGSTSQGKYSYMNEKEFKLMWSDGHKDSFGKFTIDGDKMTVIWEDSFNASVVNQAMKPQVFEKVKS